MSTVIVRRQERHEAPEMPHGEIVLQPPPEIPEVASDGLQQMMTYLPMLAMTFGMVAMMSGSGSGSLRWVGGGAMGLGMGGMALGQMARGKGDRKLRLNGQRRDYLRYLGQIRRQVRRAASVQRQALEWTSPPPAALWWVMAANQHARVWERRPQDADFGTIRLGTGTQQLGVRLVPPQTKPAEDLDPLCAGALRRFIRTHARVPELPVGMSLRAFSRVCVAGDPGAARGMVRALTAQLAAFHSPEEVRICVCAPADRMREWDWAKWLPHTLHATERDAAGPVRLMAETLPQLEAMLGADIKDRPRFSPGRDTQGGGSLPYYVVIVDGAAVHPGDQLGGDGVDGVTLVQVTGGQAGPADAATLRLQVAGGRLDMITRDRAGADIMARIGAPDTLSRAEAEALARELAPLRPARGGAPGEDALAVNTTLTALLGIAEARALDLPGLWRSRPARSRLRVPIGLDASGQPVELDIKESAQGGMGPHGLVIGATGSGKSELLRTLVLGLALTHPPEALNFVLVDFKGGATFLGLEDLSHVSAVITNLEQELPLVDRMRDALHGEMVRRQELLRSAGNYASVRDYERDRERGTGLAPLPTLFVVVDEFSELLAAKPEFIDLFVMIGRLGRSLGVHLLLASQRLEEGRLRGLDTQLSYRIGLRTFSAAESRIVLGVPDAYELPSAPGSGYLKIDVAGMTRFKAAYVSGPAETDAAAQPPSPRRYQAMVVPYGPGYISPREIPAAGAAPGGTGGTGGTGRANPAEANPGDAMLGDAKPGDSRPGEAVTAGASGPAETDAAAQPPSPRRYQAMVVPYGPGYISPREIPAAGAAPGGAGGAGRANPAEANPGDARLGDAKPGDSRPGEAVTAGASGPAAPQESLLDRVVRQLAGQGQAARPIWLPPLGLAPALNALLPPLFITPRGCTTDDERWRGRLQAVAGIVDRPFEQRRDALWSDLSGAAGHVGVAGGPQSGKSTMLRTLICSLALLHTPDEVQFYCLDFGGGTVRAVAGLPHVGGVATRQQADRVRRTVAELQALLDRREREFASRGIESIAAYRSMRASGEIAGDGFGDVFLVVDGWLTVRQEYEQLETAITALAARGLGYGIHVIAATNKWSEFRPGIRDLLGTKFELRLGDPYESEMGRALAMNVPERSPGRGLTRDGQHFLTALPRIDGQPSVDGLADAVRKLVETVEVSWTGRRAPEVRMLPEVFPVTGLPSVDQVPAAVPFGIDETTLSPVSLDFSADPHFLALGDMECGKSNLLRLVAEGIVARYPPERARLIVIDYRRSLLDAADTAHRIGYAASSPAAASLVNDAREALLERLPSAKLTAEELRARSWWKGSDLYLIVDDYDLVAGATNPLLPIVDLLPQARDIGLHVVLARSAGGAGRAMFEPVVQRLREMGTPTLLMSASKDEGQLFGVKPQTLPAGRGYLVARRGTPRLVQTALASDTAPVGAGSSRAGDPLGGRAG